MDLMDFEGESLYFDEQLADEVDELLRQSAQAYGTAEGELKLMRAYFLEPQHLTVLVALYRCFYYQHRYEDALRVADRALEVTASRLNISSDWRTLNMSQLAVGIVQSMTLTRFFLMVLKGAGYLRLRAGDTGGGLERLLKVAELDSSDRLGVAALIEVARDALDTDEDSARKTAVSV
jgi:tetratricopeptide (TPR) repeat protein